MTVGNFFNATGDSNQQGAIVFIIIKYKKNNK